MGSRYAARFAELKQRNRKAFIPFTLMGWPDPEKCLDTIKVMLDCGVSALELGWAFSDPIADGPVIQQAAFETLALGFKVTDALDLIAEVRKRDSEIPIGLLVYYNMVMAQGVDSFFRKVKAAGVDGVLIADVPPESSDEVTPVAVEHGIEPIFMVSPLTTEKRLTKILAQAKGFLYAVSRLGVTGTEERYDVQLKELIDRVHSMTDLPLCVGFGISTPEQARSMLAVGADGIITGSRIIEMIDANELRPPVEYLKPYLESMMQAVSAPVC